MRDAARRALSVLAAAAVAAGAGCSSVPTASDPRRVDRAVPSRPLLEELSTDGDVREVPERPASDAQPSEIVLGFLNAQADAADARRTAREYLLRERVWDESGDAFVYSSVLRTEVEEGADPALRRVRATFQLVGRINNDGEFHPQLRRVSTDYVLQGSQGQWRLSEAPRGLWISANAVSQAFRRSVPYYVAPDGHRLVPDPVYLSRGSGQTVAALVQRVIDGPGPWLRQSGAGTRFPRGTKLRDARLGQDGVLELDFSDEINEASISDRQALVAQLVWTLTSPQLLVESLRILAGGAPFVVDAATAPGTTQHKERWSSYAPDAGEMERPFYYNRGGKLAEFRPPTAIEATGRLLPRGAQPAVDRTGSRVAVLRPGPSGTSELLMGSLRTGRMAVRLRGRHLTKPSWGAGDDGVWIVRHDTRGQPEVFTVPTANARPRSVAALEPRGRVHAFEVSRDGTRFAVVLERAGARRLYVGLITRGPQAGITSVGTLRAVAPGLNVSAVAWADSARLVLIGAESGAEPAVWMTMVDGSDLVESSDSRAVLARGRSHQLVARPDRFVVIVDDRLLFDNPGNRWLQVPRPLPGS